jgi:FMN phosphatase YigB (HAD superfamily)
MSARANGLVFMLDVDNTLLDNDRLKSDLDHKLRAEIGDRRTERFWEIYELVRRDEDFVDYPQTVHRLLEEDPDPALVPKLQEVIDSVPFKTYLYPGAIQTIAYLKRFGLPVIVSDGDQGFQPRKIAESGLASAVDDNVMIFVHKELELDKVFARYPADHYVMIDDKARILSALERLCPTTFTTILVRQGKYARPQDYSPQPDIILPAIADVQELSADDFRKQSPSR